MLKSEQVPSNAQPSSAPEKDAFTSADKSLFPSLGRIGALWASAVVTVAAAVQGKAEHALLEWDKWDRTGYTNSIIRCWVSTNTPTSFDRYFNISTNLATNTIVLGLPQNKTSYFVATVYDPDTGEQTIPGAICSLQAGPLPRPLRRDLATPMVELGALAPGQLTLPETNSQPVLSMTFSDDGKPKVLVSGTAGQWVNIQASQDMTTWNTLHTAQLPAPGSEVAQSSFGYFSATIAWTDLDPGANKNSGTSRFYRTETHK